MRVITLFGFCKGQGIDKGEKCLVFLDLSSPFSSVADCFDLSSLEGTDHDD